MKKLIKNLKISHVLIFMTVLTVTFIAGQNYNSVLNLRKSRDYVQMLKNDRIEPIILLYSIMEEYAINIVDAANKVHHKSISWEEASRKILTARAEIDKKWAQYSANIKDEESKNQLLTIRNLTQKSAIVLDQLTLYIANRDDAGLENLITKDLYHAVEPITDAIQAIIQNQKKAILQIADESDNLYNSSYSKTRNVGFLAIIIIIILALFVVKTISRSLKNANSSIKQIAEGDLTVEIEDFGNDEIGQLMHNLKRMVKNLRDIIESINSAASNIAITSHELSSNSQQISQGATEQAASVEQMAASMEQLSANILLSAKNANITEQISTQAGSEFESGRENIDTTVDAIQTIASKISIIGEIAFQTNILALNAAVEAARAGEHGRGFGVVAAEVGKLADRSKIAAAEIESLSKSGVDLSLSSKELFKIALPSINKTIELVKEISMASSEQSSGVDQINIGIQTLNQVTQQNAASSEEMATVVEEMAAQAEQLSNSISFFKIDNNNNQTVTNKTTTPKFIEKKASVEKNIREIHRGIDLDMNSRDDLDNDFETF